MLVAAAGLGLCAVAVAGFVESYAHPSHLNLGYIPPQPPAEAATGGLRAAGPALLNQPAAVPAPPPAAEQSAPAAAPPPAPENPIRVVQLMPAQDHQSKDHGSGHHGQH